MIQTTHEYINKKMLEQNQLAKFDKERKKKKLMMGLGLTALDVMISLGVSSDGFKLNRSDR